MLAGHRGEEEEEGAWLAGFRREARRMSRRSVNPSRRVSDGGLPSVGGLLHHKSRSPPVLTIALVVLVFTPLLCVSRMLIADAVGWNLL